MEQREPFLKLNGIRKSFVSDDGELTPVIDGVSMEISAGEFVVFLGPSGCGKTTLMRIVGGLETCDSGEVLLGGEKVVGPDRKKGMVFQAYTSFPWLTVFDNVRFGTRYRNDIGKKEKESVASHYMQLVGLKEFSGYYVNRISGGMRQRVAIARAMANNPTILLADEPTGNLDPKLSLEIMRLFENFNFRGTTVLVATHDITLVRKLGRRVIRIQEGRSAEV